MHGIIFTELRKFAEARAGAGAWPKVLEEAGLAGRIFLAVQPYPDEDAVAIVGAAARLTGREPQAIQEDFGEFIAPDLLKLYGHLVGEGWKTLDVIEHTEVTMHRVVRARNPGAAPPELRCTRPSPDEVIVTYASPRRMCGIAKGIARGLARHFEEKVLVTESSCMHAGDAECTISVRLAS